MSNRRSQGKSSTDVGDRFPIPGGGRDPRQASVGNERDEPLAGKYLMREAKGTRAVILDAATRVFASRGFARASMREIVVASGVNKPLIYYYFGSKRELYAAVEQGLIAESRRREAGAARGDGRYAGTRAELRRLLETFRDNEELLRICAWARLEGYTTAVESGEKELLACLRGHLERARERRIIRDDIDPGNLANMLVVLVASSLESRPNRDLDRDLDRGPEDDSYLNDVIALVERGLLPPHDEPRGPTSTEVSAPMELLE